MKKILSAIYLCIAGSTCFAQVIDSAQRKVPLQGAVNFRDLGGYETKSGKHVKWGKVYRSADISKLSDADLDTLQRRHITHDVDFRGHQESAQAPDRLNPHTDYILCPAGSDEVNNWMQKMRESNSGDSLMTTFYQNTQYLADRYKPFFQKLLTLPNNESLVFHCTAGKDRTGIGAALFLYALGVPYNTIVSDYEATNYYRKDANQKMVDAMVQNMHISRQSAESVLGVKKQYLDATFDAIRQQYGSVDNFLKTQIGLTAQETKTLQHKYLQ